METHTFLAAEATSSTSRTLTITLFLVFVAITLGITIWASRQTKTATDFYSGGRSFSGFQNGLAIGGDYMSAASFLGISGAIALYGYDGFLYSIGFLVAWLVALLLVAELLRNSGRYTMAELLGAASEQTGKGDAFLEPGLRYGATLTSQIDFISLGLALVLGTAGLPHILIRFYTVPTARDARKSVLWAIGLIGAFYLMTLVLGFGAAALLDRDQVDPLEGGNQNLASPLLAEAVGGGEGSTGGAVLLALIAAVAFATILAVVAGLTLASSSSVAHDLYKGVLKKDQPVSEKDEVRVARIAAFGIGAIAIALSIPAQRLNIAFLVALAFAVAASANLPAIIYNMFWRRFNT